MSGMTLGIWLIRKKSTAKFSKKARNPCTLLNAVTRMKSGYPCWKRHTPKSMAISVPLKEVGLGKLSYRLNWRPLTIESEGIEDLTGGVTTEFYTPDVLDDEKFWSELLRADEEFLFGCGAGTKSSSWAGTRKGIYEGHAYTVLKAVEVEGKRLVKVRNPWGQSEWTGPWSDGSKEWTPEWMIKLNHRFDDDGIFWISYEDLKRKYQLFSRTRIFGPEWSSTIQWTHTTVPWSVDYSNTKFQFTLPEDTSCVLQLSQLDSRYFRGLEGQYSYELQFRVHKEGEEESIVRSLSPYESRRSASTELDLEAGTYTVLMKISASRNLMQPTVETVVKHACLENREKLLQVGLSYDLAHAKAQFKPEKEKEVVPAPQTDPAGTDPIAKEEGSGTADDKEASKPDTSEKKDDTKNTEKSSEKEKIKSREAEAESKSSTGKAETEKMSAKMEEAEIPSGKKDEEEKKSDSQDAFPKRLIVTVEEATDGVAVSTEDGAEADEFTKDPWNAVCVVGLRVLTQKGKATIKAIRDGETSSLDVDDASLDPAKEKQAEKPEEVEKKSGENEKKEEATEEKKVEQKEGKPKEAKAKDENVEKEVKKEAKPESEEDEDTTSSEEE
jgi:hypothetical protein